MSFVVDEAATKRARAKYRLRVMKLQQAFGILQERDAADRILPPPPNVARVLLSEFAGADQAGRGTPVRAHPNTPPLRDAFHQARHRRNKAARAARRKNRR